MWWLLRDLFSRAREYALARGAEGGGAEERRSGGAGTVGVQPDLEQMREVMARRTPVFVHTASGRDVYQTMRMFHDEFGLPVVVSHGEFGAFRVAEEAAKRDVPVNIGPRLFDFSSLVYDRRFYSIPVEYARAGVRNVSLNTDCPVIPGEELPLQGTLAVRLGMDEDAALRALTIHPATAIGAADRIGSIEVGKDADLVFKRGSLFDPRTPVERVLINGRTVYRYGQPRRAPRRRDFHASEHPHDDCCDGGHRGSPLEMMPLP
jgi:imidazolonepropionase-like amidohydrolase